MLAHPTNPTQSMNIIKMLNFLALVLASSFAMAENGVTDKEILIGQFAALSGPAAQLGQRMQLGMQAYFLAVNAQGGVNGRTIKLKTTRYLRWPVRSAPPPDWQHCRF